MPQWVEGIDFEVLPDQKVRCLHCSRVLESKAGLGPHLSKCVKPTLEAPPKPEEATQEFGLPTEEEALDNMLREMGVKRAKPIARLMAYSGWDNFEDLANFLKLSGVGPDRVLLCLEA